MSKLKPITVKKALKNLIELGFDEPISVGNHLFMIYENIVLRIPDISKKPISPDLLARILKQAEIRICDWNNT